MSAKPGRVKWYQCRWCGKDRGQLPSGVLICPRCDYDHAQVTVIPNEYLIKDVEPRP